MADRKAQEINGDVDNPAARLVHQRAGANRSAALAPLDAIGRTSDIAPAALRQEAAATFALWEAAANIAFEASDDPATAQIPIGTEGQPRGWAFADVLYDRAGDAPSKRIDKALICLNADAYDLRYALAHEIGHAIGLNHPGPTGQAMAFEYAQDFRTLQPGNQSGAIALYDMRGAPEPVVPPKAVADDASTVALRGRPTDRRWIRSTTSTTANDATRRPSMVNGSRHQYRRAVSASGAGYWSILPACTSIGSRGLKRRAWAGVISGK